MQTQAKFCIFFSKININFFSGELKHLLIPKVGPKPNIKKLFLQFSTCVDELLSKPKL